MLFNYEKEGIFKSHYHLLKSLTIEFFYRNKIKSNSIIEDNSRVGKAYNLNTNKKNEIKKEFKNEIILDNKKMNEKKDQIEYINKVNISQNKTNIRFLFKLHFFVEKLKNELNNNSSEISQINKCYLIKKELIDKYIDFYQFDTIIKESYQQTFSELRIK